MKRVFVFKAEIPYDKISIKKTQELSKKVFLLECDGNKKVIKLKFLFKEVKFRC